MLLVGELHHPENWLNLLGQMLGAFSFSLFYFPQFLSSFTKPSLTSTVSFIILDLADTVIV